MKVFISSVIAGFEAFRDAVEQGVSDLGHSVIRAESFAATDTSSRVACLSALRDADLIVLLLGSRYGTPLPPLGVSPTHEEFLEAKGTKPILVFVQEGVERELAQDAFVEVVESWDEGRHRRAFRDPDQLRAEVTRSIHEYELRKARAPVDAAQLVERALKLIEKDQNNWGRVHNAQLRIGIAGGPAVQILRPRELENQDLESSLGQLLLFGPDSLFDRRMGLSVERSAGFLSFTQQDGRRFAISEQGDVFVSLPILQTDTGIPCIIIEELEELIRRSMRITSEVLDQIDGSNRLSRLVVAMRAAGTEYVAWRTKAEHNASPNSVTHNAFFAATEPDVVTLSPPDIARAALRYDEKAIAEDFAALLQREATREGRGW